jgi:hypothetical protein
VLTIPIRKSHKSSAFPGAGKVDIVQLDKGNDWERMSLRLRYSVTLAGASNTVANTKKGDAFGPISLFQLVAGSGEPIWSCSGHRLRKLAEHWRGNRLMRTVTIGDGASVNIAVDDIVPLNFLSDRCSTPFASMLRTAGVKDLTARFTYQDGTFFNSAAAATYLTAPTIDILMREREPLATFRPDYLKKVIETEKVIAGATTQFRFDIDTPDNTILRRLYINQQTSAGVDSAGIISNLKLVSAGYEFANLTFPNAQQDGDYDADLPPAYVEQSAGQLAAANSEVSGEYLDSANCVLDLVTDGDLRNGLPLGDLDGLYLEGVALGAGKLVVTAETLVKR